MRGRGYVTLTIVGVLRLGEALGLVTAVEIRYLVLNVIFVGFSKLGGVLSGSQDGKPGFTTTGIITGGALDPESGENFGISSGNQDGNPGFTVTGFIVAIELVRGRALIGTQRL